MTTTSNKTPKVALVCDWLTEIGGAERVLKAISDIYPDAPIYTSQYRPNRIDWFKNRKVITSYLNFIPAKLRKIIGPLRQFYFSHLDLSSYDIIISITGAEAKAIKQGNAKHLCYCHVPTQYYWQFYQQYLENPGFGWLNPLIIPFFKLFVNYLRKKDYESAQRPDQFITISKYSANQIKKYYGRDSIIIYPPVNTKKFQPVKTSKKTNQQKHFINFSRQVNWKRLDLAILACLQTNSKLTIIGDGPEHNKLKKLANNSDLINFIPPQNSEKLNQYLQKSDGYLFPSLEPFGIAPIEALSAGCPVIAYGEGGAKDYINNQNGLFFKSQDVKSLVSAINKFNPSIYNPKNITKSVSHFSEDRFKSEIIKIVKRFSFSE